VIVARLQILQLPEGADDERAPFVLVVDQMEPQRYILSAGMQEQPDQWDVVAKQIGARGSIVVPDTINIPANDVPPLSLLSAEADDEPDVDFTEMIETVDRVLGINSGRGKPDVAGWLLTACRELEKSEDARAHLRSERDALKAAAAQPAEPVSIGIKGSPLTKQDVADAVRQEIDRTARLGQRGVR
jgi:hypothetical protein